MDFEPLLLDVTSSNFMGVNRRTHSDTPSLQRATPACINHLSASAIDNLFIKEGIGEKDAVWAVRAAGGDIHDIDRCKVSARLPQHCSDTHLVWLAAWTGRMAFLSLVAVAAAVTVMDGTWCSHGNGYWHFRVNLLWLRTSDYH